MRSVKKHKIFFVILVFGLFFRIYKAPEFFLYGHDQDLAGWFVRDVVVNKHLRLIGQETSTQGIFIGPYYYYLLIPFYLLTGMDPIGGVFLITLLGVFTVFSVYFVFDKIFGRKTAIIGAIIYSLSFYTIFNDREVVPTMPVTTFTLWFMYGIHLLFKDKTKVAYILFGFLAGLVWNINFALILLFPLILVTHIIRKSKPKLREMVYGVSVFFITSLPLIIFEARHGLLQTKALIASLTTSQHDIISGIDKFNRVIHLMSKNVHGIFMGALPWLRYETVFYLLLFALFYLFVRGFVKKRWFLVFVVWIGTYLTFFSLYSKILSEYYLNGTVIVWIAIASIALVKLIESENYKHFGVMLLSIFIVFNLLKYFRTKPNESGYLQRKAVAGEITRDAKAHSFPCVSVSYITKPGYDLGYRYFYWMNDLHANHPKSGSPVYTIVYPLRKDIEVDETFGALGLIYPDYKLYNMTLVKESCSGDNSNITDPMWGFTQ